MTQKDPIWPVRELMGYRPLKRATATPQFPGASAIEPLERRSMISGPMAIALTAAIAPACETRLGFDANDNFKSGPDQTAAALTADNEAGAGAFVENPGDAYEDATSKCRPEMMATESSRIANKSEIPRTYTLATIHLPTTQDVRHRNRSHGEMVGQKPRQASNPDLALQIMASGVAIDFDQAAEVSAMLNHHTLLPGIVFNPVAGIAALVA